MDPKLDSTPARERAGRKPPQSWKPARQKLMAEGKPVFIIGGHYGITGELTFNLPEAKAGLPDHPLVYFESSSTPMNQFYFWPGYENRQGQNAIYTRELEFSGSNSPDAPGSLKDEI